MKALILAAGYATRLYPLTKEFPKPLLLVKGRPIINYIVAKLETIKAIDEIIVVTNSKFIRQFRRWADNLGANKKISLADDLTSGLKTRRGAIGDMHFAIDKKRLCQDLLVIGGDNLFEGGLSSFLNFALSHKPYPSIGIYDIKDKQAAKKYGVIKINGLSEVIDFAEKPTHPKSTLVAMCLYYFPKDSLRLLKEYLKSNIQGKDATGFYIDWLRKKILVYAFKFSGQWFDIGDHKFYSQAKEEFGRA